MRIEGPCLVLSHGLSGLYSLALTFPDKPISGREVVLPGYLCTVHFDGGPIKNTSVVHSAVLLDTASFIWTDNLINPLFLGNIRLERCRRQARGITLLYCLNIDNQA